MSIQQIEKETYEEVWAVPNYDKFSPGEKYLDIFLDMSKTTMRGSVLDAGCGSGKGAVALKNAGFAVSMCDITDSGLIPEAKTIPFTQVCLWEHLTPKLGFYDWVYCCDVMEHIPTAFTMLTIQRLLQIARRGVFLSIALVPDNFGVWVGHPLHQTVESFNWWKHSLNEIGNVVEARDLIQTGIYLVSLKP